MEYKKIVGYNYDLNFVETNTFPNYPVKKGEEKITYEKSKRNTPFL